ncbi:MAG: hypothetical protein ACE5JG_05635, partial [Planctomycetota bacterium]
MRALSILILLVLPLTVAAQDPGSPGDGGKGPIDPAAKKAAAEPETPAWKLPERHRKKLASLLEEYLRPGRRTRAQALVPLQKFVQKGIDGHSPLEDVDAITDIANHARAFGRKVGTAKGRVMRIDVPPRVHGFPIGLGTVRYHLYVPKDYNPKQLWPLIFCLPDNTTWPDGAKYVHEMWVDRVPEVAAGYLILVPIPQSKGDAWTKERSWARAMIALRHCAGTFDADPKSAGAAVAAARFSEMFVGAVLHDASGRAGRGHDLRRYGGLSDLPAYCVVRARKGSSQKKFADKLFADNNLGFVEVVREGDENLLGDAKAIYQWMTGLEGHAEHPAEIRYTVHDGSYQRHHWITVREHDPSTKPRPMFFASADRKLNTITIEPIGILRFELFLNDALLDLGDDIRIVIQDSEMGEIEFFKGKVERDLGTLLDELVASNHPWRVYPVRFVVDLLSVRAEEAKRRAAEEAKKK